MSRANEAPELGALERLLEEGDDLLRRQIHPNFYDRATRSLARHLFKMGGEQISVTQDRVLNAPEAHRRYVANGNDSVGSCVVSVKDVIDGGARAVDDSSTANAPYGHAYIDARGFSGKDRADLAEALRLAAESRDLYLP